MKNVDLESLVASIVALSRQAGEKILHIYRDEIAVEIKADSSPLTEADLASHHCLVDAIQGFESGFPIISEESDSLSFETRKTWETYWLIDPLDGTKEFIKKNGEFTVNVALIHNHEPVLGVVYVPVKDDCYFAAKDLGAFKQTNDNDPVKIQVRTKTPEIPTVAGSRSHKTGALGEYLEKLGDHDIISMGSSLKFCLVAEGAADLYPRLGLTSEWDTAAAHCVVEQAGGKITQLDGSPLLYNTKDSYLNPYFLVYGDSSRDWTAYAN